MYIQVFYPLNIIPATKYIYNYHTEAMGYAKASPILHALWVGLTPDHDAAGESPPYRLC